MRLLLFLLIVFFACELPAQTPLLSPLQVVEQYVSPQGFPDKKSYVSGELTGERKTDTTLGQRLPLRVQRHTRLVRQDSTFACVAVWLHDSLLSTDYYFYLRKKEVWSMYAIRTLTGTAPVKAALARLDSVPPAARGKAYTAAHSHSWAFEKANCTLFLGCDSVLKTHFISNRKTFVNLQTTLAKNPRQCSNDSLLARAFGNKKISRKAGQLLIRSVVTDPLWPGTLLFLIGGTSDNRVGYLYQPDPAKIPPVSARNYILIEPLGNGWYLFKTT
ncbi:MAG: hypothetical protein IM638_17465 [Bacteroidetes bacterium]|nr:hypothetical protein [Bacteroidota bacterium]